MGIDALRRTEQPPAAIYWRRRFVVLVLGLAVLALVIWAFGGALGAPVQSAKHHAHRPTAAAHSRAQAAKSLLTATGPTRKKAAAHSAPATHRVPVTCPSGDVVLSLFPAQTSYLGSAQFQIDVVSTDFQPCAVNIGARHLLLRVSQAGKQIWFSGQCATGHRSRLVVLQRGVPAMVPVSWDGRRSSSTCAVAGALAPAGIYAAVAVDGPNSSQTMTFRMSPSLRHSRPRQTQH